MKSYFKIFFSLFFLFFHFFSVAQEPATSMHGLASFYSDKFNGRKTASGEKYFSKNFTAAHRTLPFNTIVKVTNLKNNKSVLVRINDRGPHKRSRIIDISRSAADKINLTGITKVTLEVVAMEEGNHLSIPLLQE